ncbi:MAG: SIR2 family NAD-dependent protein deacylase [Achromobacter sp.]|uniref:SIR2 family NAD-dependent protein deacylase n=1 Tax=Achromobacter sp. TaxID=134375 RepID=UPI003D0028E4
MKISTISDFPALKKLAATLWQQDNAYHGAAIMVGAGFSRCAASTGDIGLKLPLWHDFSRVLARELGSNNNDPLRLAEEYCAFFGKQALHDLIKNNINDMAWSPGEMHRSLLELPWSEILTTNWDTLIERASLTVQQPAYNVVSKQQDLASTRHPRIVKLHGTINLTDELVFTQEDYRTYPQNNAAFVNFARQVFIENELCLLGFSGDDPNFLQWAGWVRDQLPTNSRRIYLVGVLGLHSAKRKYLDSINVAPIDLAELVQEHDDVDTKHATATKLFIEALHDLKPRNSWEWTPKDLNRITLSQEEHLKTINDLDYAASRLEHQVSTLATDRESYPGWVVCPTLQQWRLQNQLSDPYPTSDNLEKMNKASREKLLYEIAWRHELTFEVLPLWLAQQLFKICDPDQSGGALSKKQRLEIALLLVKNSKWFDEPEFRSIELAATELLKNNNKFWPEIDLEIAYNDALLARDSFNYVLLEQHIEKINSSDPGWKLKKASLLAELCQFERGEALIKEAHRDFLNSHRKDRKSIYILSRLAWTQWLVDGINIDILPNKSHSLSHTFQDAKCNPKDYIDNLANRISASLEAQRERSSIEPSFEPGRYVDNSTSLHFSNENHPILIFHGICSSIGVPIRWKDVAYTTKTAEQLCRLESIQSKHRFSLAIRTATSDTSDILKIVFSRTQVACMTIAEVNFLFESCKLALNYWTKRLTSSISDTSFRPIERVRVFTEVLARISIRATPHQAKEFFELAVSLGKQNGYRHPWLMKSLGNLLIFSLGSVPKEEKSELLLSALSFPLRTEAHVNDSFEWPNPIIEDPGKRKENAALDRRIDEIIDSIDVHAPRDPCALLRLLPLIKKEYLNDSELKKVAEKLWGAPANYQTIPNTGLLISVLLTLPAPHPEQVRDRVRHHLFDLQSDQPLTSSLLRGIIYSARPEISELPSSAQASSLLNFLLAWRPKPEHRSPLGFSRHDDQQISGQIGEALSRSIVPALSSDALTEHNFQQLLDFYTEADSPQVLPAFSHFAASNSGFAQRVEKLLQNCLQSSDQNKIAHSAIAIAAWRKLQECAANERLITRFSYLIGTPRVAGLPALLGVATSLLEQGSLDNHAEALAEILPVIFDTADYGNISPSSEQAVTASLIRAACVHLARAIQKRCSKNLENLSQLLLDAKQDPLPEVRFA